MLTWFDGLALGEFVALLTLANVGMYVGSWGLVSALQRGARESALNVATPRVTRGELGLSLAIVAVNIAVGLPGWWLWRAGAITLVEGSWLAAVGHLLLIVAVFDVSMYVLHRLAHTDALYRRLHASHHAQVDVSGLSLYIMNPAEALGFGALLIGLLLVVDLDIRALLAFLTLNWAYGTLGHSGVRFESRVLRWLAGDSAFHHAHHSRGGGNYGFFTPVWDRLLGTTVDG
jgi:lathosterol oxidase